VGILHAGPAANLRECGPNNRLQGMWGRPWFRRRLASAPAPAPPDPCFARSPTTIARPSDGYEAPAVRILWWNRHPARARPC